MSGPTGRKLTRSRVVSLMCYLMSHECTVRQLARFMGMSRTCAGDWIRELHKNGKHKCVHITGYSKTLRGGYPDRDVEEDVHGFRWIATL